MKRRSDLIQLMLASTLVCAAAAVISAKPPAQNNPNPGVAPRGSKPRGLTYEQWSGALLKWVYSQPADASPLIDSTGALTQSAESGNVWFLMGPSELVDQPQVNSITMASGTAIFFSPLGFFAAGPTSLFLPCPTRKECHDFVQSLIFDDHVIAAQDVEIDGVPVSDLDQYLVVSPAVPLNVAADSFWIDFLGEPGPFSFGVFGGLGLFIEPLPPGSHVIHARTTGGGEPFEITYNITVRAKK